MSKHESATWTIFLWLASSCRNGRCLCCCSSTVEEANSDTPLGAAARPGHFERKEAIRLLVLDTFACLLMAAWMVPDKQDNNRNSTIAHAMHAVLLELWGPCRQSAWTFQLNPLFFSTTYMIPHSIWFDLRTFYMHVLIHGDFYSDKWWILIQVQWGWSGQPAKPSRSMAVNKVELTCLSPPFWLQIITLREYPWPPFVETDLTSCFIMEVHCTSFGVLSNSFLHKNWLQTTFWFKHSRQMLKYLNSGLGVGLLAW